MARTKQSAAEVAYNKAVGICITAHRKAAKLTQQQLAVRVGISRSWIADIETGRKACRVQQVRAIADALGIPTRALLPRVSRGLENKHHISEKPVAV